MTKTTKKRSPLRKILKITLFSILGLIILLLLLPILFKPQIIAFAKKQLNNQLSATVDFKDIDISLIRHFPRLDVKLVDLSIVGKDYFKGDTFLYSPSTHIVTNVKTLFRSNVKVYEVELIDPLIRAKVDSTGRQNFDISKPSTGPGSAEPAEFSLDLEKYSIKNGTLSYYDDQIRIYTDMQHFNHSGSGNFTADKFGMKSATTADSVYFKYGTVTYFTGATLDLPLDLNIDTKQGQYDFTGEKILLNSVPLSVKGMVKDIDDSSQNMDITVKTQQADFKNILTLLPGVYTQDINKFQTSGKAVIDGKISGVSNPSRIPDFNFKIDVQDGMIKNPDFSEPLQQINVNAVIENTGGTNDATVITLKNGSANVGSEPVRFAVGISHPVTSMIMDLSLQGKVQLEKIQKILKLGDMELRGLLNADLNAHGPLAAFEGQQANAINASGTLVADNFYYSDKSTGTFDANNVKLNFTNAEASIAINNGNYNKTAFSANGTIYNFFNYLFVNSPLRGKLSASSPEVNLANWTSSSTASTSSSSSSKPFVVPANMMLDITAHTDRLISDKIVLSDLGGKVLIAGQKLLLEDVAAKGLGGSMNISGSYSSEKTPLQPDITLHYKLNSLDVQQTYNAIATAASLMPIGKYLSGTVSSELSATGKLGDNFFPVLNSLDGDGNLLLLNGLLQKFAPLEKIAERLGIDKLRSISTKEIRNRFSFENGKVEVLPFKFTIFNNYDFEVAGRHGFDNTMDYAIKLSLPRKELGEKGNQLYQGLLSKISKTGLVELKADEKISFFIKLGGTLTSPALDIQLDKIIGSEFDNLKKQAEAQVKSKIDSAKSVLKDTLKTIKDDILHGLKDKILNKKDTAQVQTSKDTSKTKKPIIKSVIDIFNRKKKKDSL